MEYRDIFKNTVFLFDIDGTLLTTNGSGRKAMNKSLQRLLSIENALDKISLAGTTDRGIFYEALKNNNHIDITDEEKTTRLYEQWKYIYAEYLYNHFKAGGAYSRPCRGVKDFILLLKRNNVKMGLLTGNTTLGAYLKLKFAGLARFFYPAFSFGANEGKRWEETEQSILKANKMSVYGDVSKNRNDLPPVLTKAGVEEKLIIIGDTSKDIECALSNSHISVAVTTGFGNTAEMKEMNPHIITDILNPEILEKLKKYV